MKRPLPIAEILGAALALNLCYLAVRKAEAIILDIREATEEKVKP